MKTQRDNSIQVSQMSNSGHDNWLEVINTLWSIFAFIIGVEVMFLGILCSLML